jgi:hypothetical protein
MKSLCTRFSFTEWLTHKGEREITLQRAEIIPIRVYTFRD